MSEIVDVLARMPNPLATAVVSERDIYEWSGEVPDVDSIHGEARAALLQAACGARGARARLILVRGDGGDGKTHLLAWLRRQEGRGFHFCAVGPMPDAGEPFRHGLRYLMASLRRADHALPDDPLLRAPLGRLLWSILLAQAADLLDSARLGLYDGTVPAGLRQAVEAAGTGAAGIAAFARAAASRWQEIEPALRRYLQGLPHEDALDLSLRAVLVQYPYPDRQAACVAWLAGEDLAEARLDRLGVAQAISTEAAARRVLTALCRGAPSRVVLSYDQIEGILDRLRDPGLTALADLIAELHQHGGALLQVVACHQGAWQPLLVKLRERLGAAGEEVHLAPLAPEQVRDLIAARLHVGFERAGAPERPSRSYPFTEEELLSAAPAAGLRNARAALRHFEGEFERRRDQLVKPGEAVNASSLPPPTTDAGVVEAARARAIEQVRGAMAETLPGGRAAQLRAVLRELCEGLRKQPRGYAGVQVTGCDPILGGGLRLSVQVGGGGAVRAALEISNAEAGPALFGAAARIARQVQDGRAEVALLLREQGLPAEIGAGGGVRALVPRAGSVEAQLGERGGLFWLSQEETVELLAVERALHAASSREITAGPRAIGRPEALALLLGRPEGPPAALRRLLGRLRQVGSEVVSGEPGRATPPAPEARTPALAQRPAEAPAAPASAATPRVAGQKPTRSGIGLISIGPDGAPRPKVSSLPPAPSPGPSGHEGPGGEAPAPPRPTLARMPAVPLTAVTAQQVLTAIGARAAVEERVLAEELGIAEEALPALLEPLLQDGKLRVAVQGGVRVVIRGG